MSNIKEQIRKEIERRMLELARDKYIDLHDTLCRTKELNHLLAFIDSLPEEKPSEDLLDAAKEYASKTLCDPDDGPSTGLAKESFIAGAKWMKERMIKEAEDMVNNIRWMEVPKLKEEQK